MTLTGLHWLLEFVKGGLAAFQAFPGWSRTRDGVLGANVAADFF